MSYENNTKYLAEAWIEDGKEDDFKKSFLKSLIQQLQHHKTTEEGVGFDADMVDGKHYCEIVSEFDEKLEDLMSEFDIGNTHFSKDYTNEYYVSFDGIKFNHQNINDSIDISKWPWIKDIENYNELDLYEVISGLYAYIDETKLDDGVISSSTLETLANKLNTNTGGLNADSVNGIRLWVVSREWYNQQTDEIKNDPYTLFLIQDDTTGIPADLLDAAPDTVPLSSFYEFDIQLRTVVKKDETTGDPILDETTGDPITEDVYMVVFKHERDSEWHDLAPADSFLYEDKIADIVSQILSNGNYTLNSSAITNALRDMPVDNTTDIGLTRYNKNTYVVGYRYTDDSGDTSEVKGYEGVKATAESFSYLNLDEFTAYIKKLIKKVQDDLNTAKIDLNKDTADIANIKQKIINIQGEDGNGGELKAIKDRVAALETKVTNVDKKLVDWQRTYILGDTDNDVYYNPNLKLCYTQIHMKVKYKAKNKNKWVALNSEKNPIAFKPYAGLRILISNDTEISIDYKGIVSYKTEKGSDMDLSLFGAAMYPYH